MIAQYRQAEAQRRALGVPPLPLTRQQVVELTGLLGGCHPEGEFLVSLLANRVELGVSNGAQVKARWLEQVAQGVSVAPLITPDAAVTMLGQMGGGYNVSALIRLLSSEGTVAAAAALALKGLIKVYDAFDQVVDLAETNPYAMTVLESWAAAEWFTMNPAVAEEMRLTVYKVDGEINTDDFSPGNQAQSRADIPLHATFFGCKRFSGGIEKIAQLRLQGHAVAFVGDVVGTGSSRKSAINSLAWHIGEDIPYTPNKRRGGVVVGRTIAPIFYATARDAGVLAIECDVDQLQTGDGLIIDLKHFRVICDGRKITAKAPPLTLLDEYRAGGRLNLIIGKHLTRTACTALDLPYPDFFAVIENPKPKISQGYTLAQKIVGRACNLPGVLPGTVCEPQIATVGSQDTTGPMTMQEIEELACLRFRTDLFMQSFCHTAAYPKASDLERWRTMTETTINCGGIALKPGDGVIHPWLNKMVIPDTVGTGGDSHTRFPMGISFPAGSGLVAFAAALGFMPLEMPPSVLVRFTGQRRMGITVRDMVNAIPWVASAQGLLTVGKQGKKNIFAGAVLEIEGLEDLSVEEAFELSDTSAERNAAACTVSLPLKVVACEVEKNIALLKQLVEDGYGDSDALLRRINALVRWRANPELLRRDELAEYLAVLEIDLATITEPLLACPNDPDDVQPLSAVAGIKIDEVFIGSCMTHLTHLQTAAHLFAGETYAKSRMWLAPSTRMDRDAVRAEGGLSIFGQIGCRVEVPGCSLCMGNQARVQPQATVISTSTRNFDNRLGDGAQVYLASTELAAISGLLGRLPDVEDYFAFIEKKLTKSC